MRDYYTISENIQLHCSRWRERQKTHGRTHFSTIQCVQLWVFEKCENCVLLGEKCMPHRATIVLFHARTKERKTIYKRIWSERDTIEIDRNCEWNEIATAHAHNNLNIVLINLRFFPSFLFFYSHKHTLARTSSIKPTKCDLQEARAHPLVINSRLYKSKYIWRWPCTVLGVCRPIYIFIDAVQIIKH